MKKRLDHYLKGYKTGNPSDAEKLGTSLAKELQERCKVEYKESGLQEDNKKNREKSGWWELVLEMWGFLQ